MAPATWTLVYPRADDPSPVNAPLSFAPIESAQTRIQRIVEAWAQGCQVGALVFLIIITLCNYRRHVLLHKLILLELFLAIWHGTFIFFTDPVYAWYLSSTAIPLYISYGLHNMVSWLKIKPFLPRWGGRFFIITLILVQPYWILETWSNFEYFNSLGSNVFETTRYFEPLCRDPWWIFTSLQLFLVIKNNYDLTILQLLRASPRFGILLFCMLVSIVFLVTDIVITARVSTQSGINPYWRLALIFKCASDAIFLDDFKSVLDRIVRGVMRRIGNDKMLYSSPSHHSFTSTPRTSRPRGNTKPTGGIPDMPRFDNVELGVGFSDQPGSLYHQELAEQAMDKRRNSSSGEGRPRKWPV